MSDNVTKYDFSHNGQRRRIVLLIVAAAVVTLALVLLLFAEPLNLDALGRRLRYRGEGRTYTFDAHSSNRFVPYGDGMAVVSTGGLQAMRDDGQTDLTVGQPLGDPAAQTGRDVTIFWDIGGETLTAVRRGSGKTLEFSTDGAILDADVSTGDAVCVAASESGYKTVLHVYDRSQSETYRWFSSGSFFSVCAVSPNGKRMAAVSLGQAEGVFESTLCWFRTDEENVQQMQSLGDTLVYDLHFTDDDTLLVVTENGLRYLSADGKTRGEYDFAQRYYRGCAYGDGFTAAALDLFRAGNRSVVVTFDGAGRQLGERYIEEELLDVSARGKYCAVLTAQSLTIYRRDLSVYASTENAAMATSVILRGDGTAILISDRSASVYVP